MNESDAQKVLFVKEIEEGDPTGKVLPRAERLVATSKARPPEPRISDNKPEYDQANVESFFVRRAELLIQTLKDFHPEARIDINPVQWKRWITTLLGILAFFLGFIANEFDSGKRLNLLAFPITIMLLWSFVVYGVNGFVYIRRRFMNSPVEGSNNSIIKTLLSQAVRILRKDIAPPTDWGYTLNSCLLNFYHKWLQFSTEIYKNHATRVMHICSVLFVLGVIGGMYLRGLETEYNAGWESTFLRPESVLWFLRIVLGPASIITGIKLPALEEVEAIHWGDGIIGENAAIWIHLFATTSILFIIIPRCFLAFNALKREMYLRANFPVSVENDPYFKKMLKVRHDKKEQVCVVPYSIELSDRQTDVLRSLIAEVYGDKTEIEFHEIVPYGGEDEFLDGVVTSEETSAACLFIIFNISSVPEDEIHGLLINRLENIFTHSDSTRPLVVVIDESHFTFRFSNQSDVKERLRLRREVWRRKTTGQKIRPLFINLHNPDIDLWQENICDALNSLNNKADNHG